MFVLFNQEMKKENLKFQNYSTLTERIVKERKIITLSKFSSLSTHSSHTSDTIKE